MPLLQVFTNVKGSDIPSDFLSGMSTMFQKAIGKPMQYIEVHLVPNQMMMFGGSDAPCAYANLVCIGKLGKEENKLLTQAVSAELAKIGIKADRMYLVFRDLEPQNCGYNNTVFTS
ncbi:macrophage migration inhibitory factor-like [Diadema setosum]|uniref:macrophage migration inhibitory factor-like n=1 Tax=Diadema antillarum TaxID=105358 RepID=UPI003A885E19